VLEYHGAHARVFQDLWLVALPLSRGAAYGPVLRGLLALSAVASLVYVVNFVAS